MTSTLKAAVAAFGADAKAKLSNVAATGQPEDQLRAPLERLIAALAELCGLARADVAAVGESSLSDLKTRPDYAITVRNALVGFVEVKAPGKGADPRRFRDKHDKAQWEKLQSLPNLLYTDGNEFSLWHDGELAGSVVRLAGDVVTSGADLDAPPGLLSLFEEFFQWTPTPRVARPPARSVTTKSPAAVATACASRNRSAVRATSPSITAPTARKRLCLSRDFPSAGAVSTQTCGSPG